MGETDSSLHVCRLCQCFCEVYSMKLVFSGQQVCEKKKNGGVGEFCERLIDFLPAGICRALTTLMHCESALGECGLQLSPNLSGHHFSGNISRDQPSHQQILGNASLAVQHIVLWPPTTKQSKGALASVVSAGRVLHRMRLGDSQHAPTSVIQQAKAQMKRLRAKKTNEEWPNKHSQLNIR